MAKSTNLLCLMAACVLAHMAAGQSPATLAGAGGGCTHTIAAGDTFWQQSQAKGTTVEAIQAANPGLKAEALQVGSVIQLPPAACGAGGGTPTGPVTPVSPTVPAMQNVPAIPTTPTVPTMPVPTVPTNPTVPPTVPTIPTTPTVPPTMPTNPTGPTTRTQPTIRPTTPTFPSQPSTPGGSCTHTIAAGDTLWALAKAHRMSVAALQQLNPGVVPEALQVGATLKVCPVA